ncbi:restriction endonuclease subunit S [Rothia sp. L_38]|uniref:restriction endonuclease subunit S n=1 Tax=Rothia sp. L_38 TaxID=3422315 RepID=UPI003D6B1AAE
MSESIVVELGELIPKIPSVNPAKFSDEVFDLLSIPAYDAGAPQVVSGSEIGSNKQLVEPGDVMISKIVPHIRRVWVVPEPSEQGRRQLASSEWIVFRTDRVLNRWLRFYLLSDSFHAQFMNTVAGVGGSLLRARPQFVKKIKLTIPPVAQQKKEAEIEELKNTIQQKREHQQELFDEFQIALFHEMFTGKDWPTKPLGEVATVVSGATPKTSNEEFWGGDINWITPAEVSKLDGIYIGKTERTLTEAGLASCSAQILPAGSVLLSSRAPIGLVAINTVPLATNQGFKSLIPGPELDPLYLYFWLKLNKKMLQNLGVGATFKELSKKHVEALKIKLPPIRTQKLFSNILIAIRHK